MKRKTKRRYCYLLERKTDGKHFCAFGNFKATSYGQHPCVLFDLLPETYIGYSCQQTPFGMARNISSDLRCDVSIKNIQHFTAASNLIRNIY